MKCPTSFLNYFPQVSAGYHKKKRGTFYWCFTQGNPKPLEWLFTEKPEGWKNHQMHELLPVLILGVISFIALSGYQQVVSC
jgi:hypothetical protein